MGSRGSFAVVAVLSLFVAACGGGTEAETASPAFVEQGSQAIDTDSLATTTAAPDAGAGGASEGGDPADGEGGEDGDGGVGSATTLPQNEQSTSENIDDLFTAMRTFNSCLEDEGQPFIGRPSEDLPDDDPRRAESYIEALTKCAAISQIQDAFAAANLGSEGKTPEEIEQQNRGLVGFADCLKGRGWNPSEMVPDNNGLLQITDLGAPEGVNFLDSDDVDDCRRIGTELAEAEAEAEAGTEAEG